MHNPFGPWNAWFAFTSQPTRLYLATQAGMLRGMAKGAAKAETETDQVVTENVGAAEQIPAVARKSNKKHRVARKAVAVAAKRDRRNRRRVRVIKNYAEQNADKLQAIATFEKARGSTTHTLE